MFEGKNEPVQPSLFCRKCVHLYRFRYYAISSRLIQLSLLHSLNSKCSCGWWRWTNRLLETWAASGAWTLPVTDRPVKSDSTDSTE